jgi:NAD(P)-dependent dehydrogenase (short-subunit alcohol dehydrogenase family)
MTAFATYPSLNGRTVLITGGGSGIGASIVEAFARNHAKVAFLDLQLEPSERLVAALAPEVPHAPLFIPCDLTDTEALRTAIARVRTELGPVAALVNNAGNDERHDLDAVTPDYWDRNIRVNLTHQFFAAQAVRPHMRELGGGSIVNLSSIAWMRGPQRLVAYAAAKAAVVGLTKALAVELGPENIRANAIAPGAVLTGRQLQLWYPDPRQVDEIVARQCLRQRLEADEIARTALFLAADDSRMITKQCLIVDAGLL